MSGKSKYADLAEDPYKALAEDAIPTPDAGTGQAGGSNKLPFDKTKEKKPLLQSAKDFYQKNVQEPWKKDIDYSGKEELRLLGLALGPESKDLSVPQRVGAYVASLGAGTRQVLDSVAMGFTDPKAAAAMLVGHVSPTAAAAYFFDQGRKGAFENAKGGLSDPDNLRSFYLNLATMAGSVGGGGKAETPSLEQGKSAPKGAGETKVGTGEGRTASKVTAVSEIPQAAKDLTRKGTKIAAGVGPERTTRPMVEKFEEKSKEATEQQRKVNEETEAQNRAAVEEHQDARRAAIQEQEKRNAEFTARREEVRQRNEDAKTAETKRGQLAQQVKQQSSELGDGIKALNDEVRTQGNKKYDTVREKVKDDPGVSAGDLADEVKAARDKWVKGSPESIRQVNDILRRAKVEEEPQSLMVDGREMTPQTDPIAWATLKADGVIPETEEAPNIKFDDLKGYSTELGDRLAKGNLPGDVYQAVKAVKDAIDGYKEDVAARNGASADLKAADTFWREYMETFYDKPSAVAETLANVGVLDPEHYAQSFISGKAAQRSIARLKNYSADLAAKAENLRKLDAEYKASPKPQKPLPEPNPKEPVEMPGKPELKAPKEVEKPVPPTVEDVKEAKGKEFKRAMAEVQRFTKYDAALLVGSGLGTILGLFSGHPGAAMTSALVEPAFFAGRKYAGYALNRPKVIEWLSRPEPEDIAIIKKLTPEGRAEVVKEIKDVADEATAHGQKITVAPEVAKELKFGKEYETSPKAATREGQGKGGANYTAAELKAFKEKNGIKDVPANEPRVGTPEHPPQKGESYDVGMEYPPPGSASSEPLGSNVSPKSEGESPAAQPRAGAPKGSGSYVTLGQAEKSQVYPGAERYGIHSGGKQLGTIVIKKEGDTARVVWFGGDEFEGGAKSDLTNQLGASGVTDVFRRYAQMHPEVKTITGERIGGAGSSKVVSGEEAGREVTIDLERFRGGRRGMLDKGKEISRGRGSAADD